MQYFFIISETLNSPLHVIVALILEQQHLYMLCMLFQQHINWVLLLT
jgi:hypothetical protein